MMSKLALVVVIGYSNLLHGKPVCFEKDMENTKPFGKVYGFLKPPDETASPKTTEGVYYLFDGKEVKDEEVISISQLYIECNPAGSPYEFDKPLPDGWLYPTFYEDKRWKKYFDTGKQEYWVFSNVHCDKKTRRLTAMSWMRSGREEGQNHKNMHKKFKDKTPPHLNVNNEDGSKGVYCPWNGWLYPLGKGSNNFFDVKGDQAFTIVNVYCRNNRVIYLHRAEHAGKSRFGDGIDKASDKKPFPKHIDYPEETDNLVRCNWSGWLYKAMAEKDEWDTEEGKRRWTYERYFIVSNKGITDQDKQNGNKAIHGRVMNPYCSKAKKHSYSGVVTAVRAYCFYPSSGLWLGEKRAMCDDLNIRK